MTLMTHDLNDTLNLLMCVFSQISLFSCIMLLGIEGFFVPLHT